MRGRSVTDGTINGVTVVELVVELLLLRAGMTAAAWAGTAAGVVAAAEAATWRLPLLLLAKTAGLWVAEETKWVAIVVEVVVLGRAGRPTVVPTWSQGNKREKER